MAGNIDFQHYEWQKCPSHLAGQYRGKEKKPTVVLEGTGGCEPWI